MTTTGTARVFVAVVPPPTAIDHLRGELAARWPAGERDPRLRPVAPERWHLTLAFLGELPQNRLDPLATSLATVLEPLAQPVVRLTAAGSFGGVAVWIGAADAASAQEAATTRLEQLARAARRAARAARCPVDDSRRWQAHLTIARVGRGHGHSRTAGTDLAARLASYQGPAWPVDSVRIVESVLGPQPRYVTRAEVPMTISGG